MRQSRLTVLALLAFSFQWGCGRQVPVVEPSASDASSSLKESNCGLSLSFSLEFQNPKVACWTGDELSPAISGVTYTHALPVTVVAFREAGWDAPMIQERLRRMARFYSQCGIKISRADYIEATVPHGWLPGSTRSFEVENEIVLKTPRPSETVIYYTGSVPAETSPAHTWPATREVLENYPTAANTLWIASNAIEAEGECASRQCSVEAHEVAHALLKTIHHRAAPETNFFSEDVRLRSGEVLPAQCKQLKKSPLLKPLSGE